jgi:hypothetical protein
MFVALVPGAKSEMLGRIADAFRGQDIPIGPPAMDVRVIQPGGLAAVTGAPRDASQAQPRENL